MHELSGLLLSALSPGHNNNNNNINIIIIIIIILIQTLSPNLNIPPWQGSARARKLLLHLRQQTQSSHSWPVSCKPAVFEPIVQKDCSRHYCPSWTTDILAPLIFYEGCRIYQCEVALDFRRCPSCQGIAAPQQTPRTVQNRAGIRCT